MYSLIKLNSETNIVVIIVGLKYTTVTVGLIENNATIRNKLAFVRKITLMGEQKAFWYKTSFLRLYHLRLATSHL